MLKWFYLTIGCVTGGFSRYLLAGAIYKKWGTGFPYGTLVINLSGCFLIGIFNSLAEEKMLLGANERVLLMAGFCGAYTTFSAFMLETSNLLNEGKWLLGLSNVLLSVLVGFVMFRAGAWLGRTI